MTAPIPTPPGDAPLIEGLGTEWNDIVSALPEDKRAELAPKLKERVTSYSSQYEQLKPWENFQKQGITPDQADVALRLYNTIEQNPRQVYETIGQHLGITPQQAQQVVEEIHEGDDDDPRIAKLEQTINTLAQITLAKQQAETASSQAAAEDARIDAEIKAVQNKYGNNVPEEELLMRMLHGNMTAEEAYQKYAELVTDIQKRRPAPFVLGAGGTIPNNQIDPTKLSHQDTRNIVAQMMSQAAAENR